MSNNSVQEDGGKILEHIFGSSKDNVLDRLSEKTGISKQGMIALMIALAPVIMGKLGQARKQSKEQAETTSGDTSGDGVTSSNSSLDAGDILSTITGMLGKAKSSNSSDSNVLGDLINIGSTLFGKK